MSKNFVPEHSRTSIRHKFSHSEDVIRVSHKLVYLHDFRVLQIKKSLLVKAVDPVMMCVFRAGFEAKSSPNFNNSIL